MKPYPTLKGEYLTEEQWKERHQGHLLTWRLEHFPEFAEDIRIDAVTFLERNFRKGPAGDKPGEWVFVVCTCGAFYPKRRPVVFERPRYNEEGQRVIVVNP